MKKYGNSLRILFLCIAGVFCLMLFTSEEAGQRYFCGMAPASILRGFTNAIRKSPVREGVSDHAVPDRAFYCLSGESVVPDPLVHGIYH